MCISSHVVQGKCTCMATTSQTLQDMYISAPLDPCTALQFYLWRSDHSPFNDVTDPTSSSLGVHQYMCSIDPINNALDGSYGSGVM